MPRLLIDGHDRARTAVRIAISVFVAVILALSALGWIWTGVHQPPTQALASRIVLGAAAASGIAALVAIWRRR